MPKRYCEQCSPPSTTAGFLTSVDFSARLGLHPHTFGNAIVTPFEKLDLDQLTNNPLSDIANIIHDLTRSILSDEATKLGSWIAAQPHNTFICHDFAYGPDSFIMSAWHRFPLYSGAELDVPATSACPTL
ncbi:hypothetical protein HD806DRAFT_482390 [Xylariaceae sp. AK1471]|nr:hypothetical protein HD806DRAFT_482390 [Xylariaceae sp. AK1471]